MKRLYFDPLKRLVILIVQVDVDLIASSLDKKQLSQSDPIRDEAWTGPEAAHRWSQVEETYDGWR